MIIQANDAGGDDLESCVRRGRAVYESSGVASAVVLGARAPSSGHGHVQLTKMDRRCVVIVNLGATHSCAAMPTGPLDLGQVAAAAPALTAWPRVLRRSAERPRRQRAREKVLDMYVRSGLLAADDRSMQARQAKRAKANTGSDRRDAFG